MTRNSTIGRATEHFLNVMGKSGTIEDRENLPKGYSIELDFPYRLIQQMINESDRLEEFEEKVTERQDEIQERFDSTCEELTDKIDDRIEDGTKVVVESAVSDKEGIVRGYTLDCGKMFYKIYDGNGQHLGDYLNEAVQVKGNETDEVDNE